MIGRDPRIPLVRAGTHDKGATLARATVSFVGIVESSDDDLRPGIARDSRANGRTSGLANGESV